MKEPKDASLLSARLARAFPSLSAYSAATLAEALCAIERAQRRHAERCCSGEDGGYAQARAGRWAHSPTLEQAAAGRLKARCSRWIVRLAELCGGAFLNGWATIELQGDPRGAVLLLRLPGDQEAVAV